MVRAAVMSGWAVWLLVGCGSGDDGMSGTGLGAESGVRPGAGWRDVLAFRATGTLGIDLMRQVYPSSMNIDGNDLQLLYAEEALGQQGPLGERFGFRFAGGTGTPTPFAAGVPFPKFSVRDTHQILWSGATPVVFAVTGQTASSTLLAHFWKADVDYWPPQDSNAPGPPEVNLGRAAISADGKHYLFGRSVMDLDYIPGSSQWVTHYCYPAAGDPPVNLFNDSLQDVDVSDPARLLQIALRDRTTLVVWRHDPALPPDVDGHPGCGPVATASIADGRAAQRFVVGGIETIVVTSPTHVAVFAYANNALTLTAETDIQTDDPIAVTSDGTGIWVAYLDNAATKRLNVKVMTGATFEFVGQPGFNSQSSDPLFADVGVVAPVLAASNGRVYAAFARRGFTQLDGGYGSMWVVTPD